MPQRRPITIEGDGARLEGALTLPDGEGPFAAAVVCHPHPQYGGSMHNNVVAAVASALVARGVAALLFGFRGVGRSEGVPGDRAEAAADAAAALAHAAATEEIDGARVGLAGYSFGAGAAAAAAAEAAPAALALISLPLSMADDAARASIAAYGGPLLLLAGGDDPGSPEDGLRALAAPRAATTELRVVPGADHFWNGDEHAVERACGPFFASALRG